MSEGGQGQQAGASEPTPGRTKRAAASKARACPCSRACRGLCLDLPRVMLSGLYCKISGGGMLTARVGGAVLLPFAAAVCCCRFLLPFAAAVCRCRLLLQTLNPVCRLLLPLRVAAGQVSGRERLECC